MTVTEVLVKYNEIVPFPWTPKKIKKAGFDPKELFITIDRELQKCSDIDSPEGKICIGLMYELNLL